MTRMNPPSHQKLPPETTIQGLFDSEFQFAIPPYQRAYSWEEKQLAQFLLDLREQPSGKPYFLGHFLFERQEEGGADPGRLLVIDGQQRLTTVVIFFSCLLRELKRRDESAGDAGAPVANTLGWHGRYLARSDGNRLRTVDYDNPFFDRLIIEGLESTEEEIPRSQRLIREARDLFAKEMKKDDAVTLVRWGETVEKAVVTDFEVPGKVQATQIFAFQNDRGVELTELEKLKAFLMHKVYLHSAHRGEATAIRDIEQHFADIYKLTERIKLGEDQVLGHHNTAFLKGWHPALENIRTELKGEPETARVKWIKGFCHDLRESFQHVAEIEREAERECSFADPLILDAPNSWPLLLKLFRFHRTEVNSGPIRRILRLMEITLFKKAYSAGDYRSHGFHGAAKNYDGNKESLLAMLENWAQHGFQPYWAFNQGFKALLEGSYHFYPTTRYLLWKYENRLREPHRNKEMSPVDFLNLYDETAWRSTIDHIMPQNPKNLVLTQEFRDRWLNNLGNLVLMNLRKNASANNDLPADKLITLADSTLISQKNVAETIRTNGRWGEEEIEARKRKIVEFALQHWEAQ
jgi:hypothetical protein